MPLMISSAKIKNKPNLYGESLNLDLLNDIVNTINNIRTLEKKLKELK
jgi:hypothetical protein